MKTMKQVACLFLICISLCGSLLAGCSFLEKTGKNKADSDKESKTFGLSSDFSYEVPKSRPGILVSQAGYQPGSKKIAIFRGEGIKGSFEVVDKKNGEVVYTGEIEDKGYNETMEEYNSYGVFDDLKTEGSYYIRHETLGYSYSFPIREGVYETLFYLACKQYYFNRCGITLLEEFAGEMAHNACHTKQAVLREAPDTLVDVSGGWHMDADNSKSVEKGSHVMSSLLLGYELYPSAFIDGVGIPESKNEVPDVLDEVKYEADWMLKMQNPATGGVYAAVDASGQEIYVEPVTLEATAAFSAVMAKFSYLYQEYDTAYATECLRAADRAWNFVEKNRNGQELEQRFYAAAELYRATGYQIYKAETERYLESGIYLNLEMDSVLFGCVTYISTRQTVDKDICSAIVKELSLDAERIAAGTKQSSYLTIGTKEQDNNEEILHEMMRLTVVDHIISNHEYETVMENQLHYFSGRNPLCISYLDQVGITNYAEIDVNMGIMNHFDTNGELIFMMSEIMATED